MVKVRTFAFSSESLSEDVAAGILACRGGRHLAARKNHPHAITLKVEVIFPVARLSAGLEATALRQPQWPTLPISDRL
jgi:hypothetical protein